LIQVGFEKDSYKYHNERAVLRFPQKVAALAQKLVVF
jgi:hypothetical protein